MTFVRRRFRNIVLLIIAIIVAFLVFEVIGLSLQTQQYYSGWVLMGLIVGLLSFYVKKRLSIVPLGNNASWAQWHYYCGFFLVAMFLIHIEFAIPHGYVERILAGLLVLIVSVGILGLLINRQFAVRLAYLDEEIIFERIPQHISNLKQQIEKHLLETVEETKSSTLSDYYVEHLSDYFSTHRDTFSHLFRNRQPHVRRVNELEHQVRYLNEKEADIAVQLKSYLEQKNTLDNHYALQGVLKYWGILHAPIGVLLLFMILMHIVLVYAFRGAA